MLGSCALYPLLDRWIYRKEVRSEHLLEPWHERPFRSAFGVAGIVFLIMLSLGVLDDRAAEALSVEVWQVDAAWGIVTMGVPPLVFAIALGGLRRRRRRSAERREPSYAEAPSSPDEASPREHLAPVERTRLDAGAVALVAAVALLSWTVDSLAGKRRRAPRRRRTSRTARAPSIVTVQRRLSRSS